ncbi:MAG TPA: hypothetical protein VF607_12775 [Verrucomicrobiae bacterium]
MALEIVNTEPEAPGDLSDLTPPPDDVPSEPAAEASTEAVAEATPAPALEAGVEAAAETTVSPTDATVVSGEVEVAGEVTGESTPEVTEGNAEVPSDGTAVTGESVPPTETVPSEGIPGDALASVDPATPAETPAVETPVITAEGSEAPPTNETVMPGDLVPATDASVATESVVSEVPAETVPEVPTDIPATESVAPSEGTPAEVPSTGNAEVPTIDAPVGEAAPAVEAVPPSAEPKQTEDATAPKVAEFVEAITISEIAELSELPPLPADQAVETAATENALASSEPTPPANAPVTPVENFAAINPPADQAVVDAVAITESIPTVNEVTEPVAVEVSSELPASVVAPVEELPAPVSELTPTEAVAEQVIAPESAAGELPVTEAAPPELAPAASSEPTAPVAEATPEIVPAEAAMAPASEIIAEPTAAAELASAELAAVSPEPVAHTESPVATPSDSGVAEGPPTAWPEIVETAPLAIAALTENPAGVTPAPAAEAEAILPEAVSEATAPVLAELATVQPIPAAIPQTTDAITTPVLAEVTEVVPVIDYEIPATARAAAATAQQAALALVQAGHRRQLNRQLDAIDDELLWLAEVEFAVPAASPQVT